MSKKVYLIDRFDGGVNESNSPAKIEKEQLASAIDVQYRKHGRIEAMGECNLTDTHVTHQIEPGYGLYNFNSPRGFKSNDVSYSLNTITTGTDGNNSIAFGSIHGLVPYSYYNNNSGGALEEIMLDNIPYVLTFTLSGGQSLGAVTIGQADDQAAANYDWFGFMGGEVNPTQIYTAIATACNDVGSNPITAVASDTGVYYYATTDGTTYNDQTIRMTWSSSGTPQVPVFSFIVGWIVTNPYNSTPIFVHDYTTLGSFNAATDKYHIMLGGTAGTSHQERITINTMSASNNIDWTANILTIDGSSANDLPSAGPYTATAGTSVNTIATNIATNINAVSAIINADNIADGAGAAANSDFAVASTNTVTCTSDNTGEDSIFGFGVITHGGSGSYPEQEYVFIVTYNGYFYIKLTDGRKTYSTISMGGNTSDTQSWTAANPRAGFYDDGGTVRIYDTNLDNTANKTKIFKYLSQTGLFSGYGSDSTLSIEQYILVNQNVAWRYTFETNSKGIQTAAGNTLATGDQDKKMQFRIVAKGAAGSGDGTWGPTGEKNYKFYASAVYDEESETFPDHVFTFAAAYLPLDMQGLSVYCQCDPGDIDSEANYVAEFRVKAFNIYWSSEDDGYGVKNLLCTIDFKDGLIREDGGLTVAWADAGEGGEVNKVRIGGASGEVIINNPEEISTWESRNLYNWQGNTQTARFKTSTIAGRRVFAGNVKVGGKKYADRIIYSPVNQFDVFPHPENILQTSSTDGEDIRVLENTGDRLFEFKRTILYIHNISSGDPSTFFLEKTLKGMGCFEPNKIVKTNDGQLFWINKFGAYIFNGDVDKIENLRYYKKDDKLVERITLSTWQDFVSEESLVGYDGKSNTIIIKKTYEGVDGAGKIYQYDIANNAWAFSSISKYPNGHNSTNFITTNDGTLLSLSDYVDVPPSERETNIMGLRLPATDGTAI